MSSPVTQTLVAGITTSAGPIKSTKSGRKRVAEWRAAAAKRKAAAKKRETAAQTKQQKDSKE
jgi:type IV secretory pathway VirB6-like protein